MSAANPLPANVASVDASAGTLTCKENYSGPKCETFTAPPPPSNVKWIILGVVLGVIFLGVVIGVAIFMIQKRRNFVKLPLSSVSHSSSLPLKEHSLPSSVSHSASHSATTHEVSNKK
jgi:hypothetical protein